MADDSMSFDGSIDQILSSLPVGSLSRAMGNSLRGINSRQTGHAVPRATDQKGFCFFTRPQLNLTRMNVSNYRPFYNLLTENKLSYQMYTRLMLDPRLAAVGGLSCPFVDNNSSFIPVLTNNIVSLSGWPDLVVPTHTSASGLYGEEHSFVDGVVNHYESYDLDVTFRNFKGNPLIYFFYTWIKYQSLVFEGILNPYQDMITENEIDYNTRIYRIVLDQQKRYVTYIGATGASFPLNVPTGNLFDFNNENPYNTANSEISIRFRSLGFLVFEDLVKLLFNQSVAIHNSGMRKVLQHDLDNGSSDAVRRENPTVVYRVPGSGYVKVPHLLSLSIDTSGVNGNYYSLGYNCYPYINLSTNELEWWCDESKFKDSNEKDFKSMVEDVDVDNSDEYDG